MELVLSTINSIGPVDDNFDVAIDAIPEDDQLLANAVIGFAETVVDYEGMVNHGRQN
jgi:hypothetical protein